MKRGRGLPVFQPSEHLSEKEVNRGLHLVIADGLLAESMVSFTGGAFLVAMAIHLNASNWQLGLLAALPTFSSIFQLVSVWLVRRYKNRRAITVLFSFCARFPLFVIAVLPWFFSRDTAVYVLIFLLFFHYYFGSVAGASWNSWMRDLVPTDQLGAYFSKRSRLTQSLNVMLSLSIAFSLDYIKAKHPEWEFQAYALMFLVGGVFGMIGITMLARTPEPQTQITAEPIFTLLQKPLRDKNFRKLLSFNAFWAFSLNLATPFFAVYMLKSLGIKLSYIVILGILSQLSSILLIQLWGRYADRFSNKTVINICAPVYVMCIIAWTFTAVPQSPITIKVMLITIHIFSGLSTAGINLGIGNMSMKLAPKEFAIAYLTLKNMLVALFSTLAPLVGGLLADYFAHHELVWNMTWKSDLEASQLSIIHLKGWTYFFIIGGILAACSLQILSTVKEAGEIPRARVMFYMRKRIQKRLLKKNTTISQHKQTKVHF